MRMPVHKWKARAVLRGNGFTACAAALALWISAGQMTGLAQPARVVSANLCADQLVLALADPAQIVSLGPFARDESLSFLADQAKAYPANRGNAEALIDLKPELVLLGSFDSRYARAVLERRHIAFLLLEPWSDMEQGRRQIRDVADRLGHAGRGAALIARIDMALAALERSAAARPRGVSALVLHRRGYAMHSGVLAGIAQLAGIGNAAAQMGMTGSGLIALERIVAQRPGYLIVARDVQRPADQGEAVLTHPALLRLFPLEKRLVIPDRLSICAGPSTPELIERLATEIAAKIR